MPLHRNASAQFKNGRRIDGSTGGKEKFTRLSVPVERGFNLGTLFGRNGATVDAIKRYTGVSVEVSLGEVVISGGNDGCKLAEAIVGDIQKGRCLAHDITCLRTIVMVEYDGERLTYYEGEGFDEDSVWYAENFLQELRQKENASMKKTKKTKKTKTSAKMAATEEMSSLAALRKEKAALRAQLADKTGWRLAARR